MPKLTGGLYTIVLPRCSKAWASARVKNQLATFNEDKLVPLSTKPTLAADAVEVPDLGRAPNCFPKTVKALRALSGKVFRKIRCVIFWPRCR